MAAPHVTGVIALMISRNPALTPAHLRTLLSLTAQPISCTNAGCGADLVNAAAAVQAAPFDITVTCQSSAGR